MSHNDELYQKAEEAILELFGDTSVTEEDCRGNLNALLDFIEGMLDTM
jgi:hypothetical protein